MTNVQKIALTIAVLGFLAGAGTQLTDIFAPLGSIAPAIVKEIVSLSGFVSGILGVVLSFATGQANQIKAVADMPGATVHVDRAIATGALALAAADPTQPNVVPKNGAAK